MSKPKHTPGPWEAGEYVGGTQGVFVADGINKNAGICRLVEYDGDEGAEERKANAVLIAASPDLLIACKAAIAATENDDDPANPEVFGSEAELLSHHDKVPLPLAQLALVMFPPAALARAELHSPTTRIKAIPVQQKV